MRNAAAVVAVGVMAAYASPSLAQGKVAEAKMPEISTLGEEKYRNPTAKLDGRRESYVFVRYENGFAAFLICENGKTETRAYVILKDESEQLSLDFNRDTVPEYVGGLGGHNATKDAFSALEAKACEATK